MAAATPAGSGPVAAASTGKTALSSERDRKRQQLREENLRIWESGPTFAPKGALDSNLKKNTAFVKRVKQGLGADAKDQLIKELGVLNLDKYLEEVLQVTVEGLMKCTTAKDSFAAVEILSAFHARFGGPAFSKPLSAQLTSQLAQPTRAALQALSAEQREREEAARIVRQKALVRVAAEAALVEIARADVPAKGASSQDIGSGEGTPGLEWLYTVVRDLLASDREHSNVGLLTLLLKAHASALLSPKQPADADGLAAKVDALVIQDDAPSLQIPREWQAKFRKLCETYFGTLSKRILRDHVRLLEQDKRNHEAYIRSGEIFEDRQQVYETATKTLEKLVEGAKALAELLEVPMPVLREAKDLALGGSVGVNLDAQSNLQNADSEERYASGKSPWEDEDTRRFYEDLPDLKDMIPSSLLVTDKSAGEHMLDGWGKERAQDADGGTAGGAATDASIVADTPAEEAADAKSPALDGSRPASPQPEEDAEATPAGPAAQLNALLAKLPEMTNRTMIDSAAVDFVFLNNKLARRKLVKALTNVPRNRNDLLPYYSRLIATLSRYMPDIATLVVSTLDDEFRYFQRKKVAEMHEGRVRNVRYISELTKFKVMPVHIIFHCLKVCLDSFASFNIDNLAGFLEGCGRFLLRTPETSERMQSALELLRRKRATTNLDHRQVLTLNNAYYQCNPPERRAIERRERTPMELFLQHLISNVLSKKHYEKVLKLLRKLHWEDPAVVKLVFKVFTKVWKVKFSHVHLIAILLHDLQPYHPDFTVRVIDQICEDIRAGMEANIFKNNQRRVATVKLLGELYNYRMINSGIVFDQLWSFTTFGHRNGTPLPGEISPIDAPDDYFRVRLVCTLLDTCGMCFDRGSPKKRLDEFLPFFNLYITAKQQPLPMDVDFMLSDLLESLRPDFELKKTFEEALAAVQEMEKSRGGAAADHDAEDSDESSDDGEGSQRGRGARSSGATTPVDSDSETETIGNGNEQQVEDEALAMRRERERQIQEEQDREFERELAKMMADSSAGGGGARTQKGLFDAGIPLLKKQAPATAGDAADSSDARSDRQHMKFSLLSKRGNKVLTHDVDVPVDAAIAVNTRTKQMRDAAERQQLKQLVLSYEGRAEEREDEALLSDLRARFKVRVNKDRAPG